MGAVGQNPAALWCLLFGLGIGPSLFGAGAIPKYSWRADICKTNSATGVCRYKTVIIQVDGNPSDLSEVFKSPFFSGLSRRTKTQLKSASVCGHGAEFAIVNCVHAMFLGRLPLSQLAGSRYRSFFKVSP
jgi:hypothetical protein